MSPSAEPALPAVREAHHLPPKSYADAADPEVHVEPVQNQLDGSLNPEPSNPEERQEHGLPPKSYADVAEQPPTDGVAADAHADNASGASVNGDDGSKRARKGQPNGHNQEDGDVDKLVYRGHRDSSGDRLKSVKPSAKFEGETRQGSRAEEEQDKSELVSGRRAGAGWQRSTIRFAPLNIPLQRRLQTLVVLLHTLSIAITLTCFFFLCSIPLFWPILLPYLIYVLVSDAGTSGELSHRSDRFRRSKIWSLFASYFPARLHRTAELPPTRKYIFGYHPHGIISHGAFAAFATEALGFSQLFPGITNSLLTLDSNFRIPLYREYALRMGLASVSRESCENILSKGGPNGEGMGRAITIVVGGARESLDAQPGVLRLVLARRKGFVKLAIRTGADLVPVLAFGENELYEQFDAAAHPRIHRFQLLVKRLAGFTVPLFHARGVFNYDVGMMPYRRPLNVVVGRPIKVRTQDRPEPDYVDRVHAEYVAELRKIWDEWKDTFAPDRKEEMQIIE